MVPTRSVIVLALLATLACASPPLTQTPGSSDAGGKNPSGGTVICLRDAECGSARICESGTCLDGCTLDLGLCSANQVCSHATGRCANPSGSTDGGSGYYNGGPTDGGGTTGCTEDYECDAASVCRSGQCVAACRNSCAAGTSCNVSTGQCETNQVADGGGYESDCVSDSDCRSADLICDTSSCDYGCKYYGCNYGEVCNSTTNRCASSPTDGGTVDPVTRQAHTSGNGGICAACEWDTDCAGALSVCWPSSDGAAWGCSTDCGQNQPCPSGYACQDVSDDNGAGAKGCVYVTGSCPSGT